MQTIATILIIAVFVELFITLSIYLGKVLYDFLKKDKTL